MTKKRKTKSNKNRNKVQEPEAAYKEKRITFFDSLESMNEHDQQVYAQMTPEERLRTVFEMRNAVWPDEQTTSPFGRHIYFKK
jgi:hypothetical protein